jgi:hypothetical protein
MPTDPDHDQTTGPEDAGNQGVSTPEPAEGSDESSAPGPDSPGQ